MLGGGEAPRNLGGGGGNQLLSPLPQRRGNIRHNNFFFSEEGIEGISIEKLNFFRNLFYWQMDYGQDVCHKIIYENATFFC